MLIRFKRIPDGPFQDWHGSPCCQRVLLLSGGQMEVVVGDGTTRPFSPGDAVLFEDLTGHGHTSRSVAGDRVIANLALVEQRGHEAMFHIGPRILRDLPPPRARPGYENRSGQPKSRASLCPQPRESTDRVRAEAQFRLMAACPEPSTQETCSARNSALAGCAVNTDVAVPILHRQSPGSGSSVPNISL